MLRSTATRSLLKGFAKVPAPRLSSNTASTKLCNATPLRQLNNKRPQVLLSRSRPTTISLLFATKSPGPYDPLDPKQVKETLESKIRPHPDNVSTKSAKRDRYRKKTWHSVNLRIECRQKYLLVRVQLLFENSTQ